MVSPPGLLQDDDGEKRIYISPQGDSYDCLQYALDANADKLIDTAERSHIIHQMQRRLPHKTFLDVPGVDGCSCNACPYMRLNTLEKLWQCLETGAPAIEMDETMRMKALKPIEAMLAMSR